MRVAIKSPDTAETEGVVLPLDRLRDRLEEALLSALESWELEKKRLEEMVARAEAKEREFRQVADDVKKRLDALDLVSGMVREVESERTLPRPEPRPMLRAAPKKAPVVEKIPEDISENIPELAATQQDEPAPTFMDVPIRSSSRPLFTAEQRARAGQLSILP